MWSLAAIERDSWRKSRQVHTAWRDGLLTSLQATTLLPAFSERYGDAWIRRAGEGTLRRLGDEVAWALDHGQEPPYRAEPAPPPLDADIRQDGVADLADEEVQKRAHGPAPHAGYGIPGAVRMDFVLPLSVAVLLESTLDLIQRPHEGRWHRGAVVVIARLDSRPGGGVHQVGHPFRRLFTPAMISFTATSPSPLGSPARHVDTSALPRAIFTIWMSSLTVT